MSDTQTFLDTLATRSQQRAGEPTWIAARRQAGLSWWALPVPPQRSAVNPVRPGREQPQRWNCVPGCGW